MATAIARAAVPAVRRGMGTLAVLHEAPDEDTIAQNVVQPSCDDPGRRVPIATGMPGLHRVEIERRSGAFLDRAHHGRLGDHARALALHASPRVGLELEGRHANDVGMIREKAHQGRNLREVALEDGRVEEHGDRQAAGAFDVTEPKVVERPLGIEPLAALGDGPRAAAPKKLVDGDRLLIPLDSIALEDMDRLVIETALARNDHNVTATARMLGTTRETLRCRIQKYGLDKGGDD